MKSTCKCTGLSPRDLGLDAFSLIHTHCWDFKKKTPVVAHFSSFDYRICMTTEKDSAYLISQYVDPQMGFMLTQFDAECEPSWWPQFQRDCLSKTYLFDLMLANNLDVSKKEAVMTSVDQLTQSTSQLLEILLTNKQELTNEKQANREMLSIKGVTDEKINELYQLAKMQLMTGKYEACSDLISNFQSLSTDHEALNQSTWVKMTSDILCEDYQSALLELSQLRGEDLHDETDRLKQIHYGLFILFGLGKYDKFVDLIVFGSGTFRLIQEKSLWILRYVIVSMLMSNQYKKLRDILRIIETKQREINDPFAELFSITLGGNVKFGKLNSVLEDIVKVTQNDYFLRKLDVDLLMKRIHFVILGTITKIYKGLTLETLPNIVRLDPKYITNDMIVDGVISVPETKETITRSFGNRGNRGSGGGGGSHRGDRGGSNDNRRGGGGGGGGSRGGSNRGGQRRGGHGGHRNGNASNESNTRSSSNRTL